jgi:hypothetical protein
LDQGQMWSRIPSQSTPANECRSCAIARPVSGGGKPTVPYVVENVDEDVVVIRWPELDGLVVIPRRHVGGLEQLPAAHRAHVLAALRRVTQTVHERSQGPAARVLALTDPPASPGHVWFQVVPNGSDDPVGSAFGHL